MYVHVKLKLGSPACVSRLKHAVCVLEGESWDPVLILLPLVVQADQYLSDSMGHLLGCLKKEKERTAAFQALGLLVVAVRTEIQPYLSKILEIIKAALPPKDFAHKSVNTNWAVYPDVGRKRQ